MFSRSASLSVDSMELLSNCGGANFGIALIPSISQIPMMILKLFAYKHSLYRGREDEINHH